MSTTTQTLISWKLSFLEGQIQKLKELLNKEKIPQKTISLKGIIKNTPDFEMKDFEQAEKFLFQT